jgi:hypothetical protein
MAPPAFSRFPGTKWLRYADPQDAGFSAAGLEEAHVYAQRLRSAAVMVIRGGAVLCDWGRSERRFRCHALRESILHATLGCLAGAGRFDAEKTLAAVGIDEVPPLSPREGRACLADLLRARSGIYRYAAYEAVPPQRPANAEEPGSRFYHSGWNINALAAIFERLAGEDLFSVFEREIALPLGMQDFRRFDGYYQRNPGRSLHSAFPCRLSTRDLARLGLLYLRSGRWQEKQVLPCSWIEEGTRTHTRLAAGIGFGQLWWTYEEEDPRLQGAFAARSPGGQAIEVLPALDLVLVHRADSYKGWRVGRAQRRKLLDRILDAHIGDPVAAPVLEPLPQPQPVGVTTLEDPDLYLGDIPFEGGGQSRIEVAGDRLILAQPTGECFSLAPRTAEEFFVEDVELSLFVRFDAEGKPVALGWGSEEEAAEPLEFRDELVIAGEWQGDLMTLAEHSFQVTALLDQDRRDEARALVQQRPAEEQAALVTLAERPEEVLSLTGMGEDGKPAYLTEVVDRLPTDLIGNLAAPSGLKYGRYNSEVMRAMSPSSFGRVVRESIDPVDQPELRVQVLLDWFRAVHSMDDVDKAAQLLLKVDRGVLEEALVQLMSEADLSRNMAGPNSAFSVSLREALERGATHGDPGRFFEGEIGGIMSILFSAAPELLREVLVAALARVEWYR